jgi:hypothetical protein
MTLNLIFEGWREENYLKFVQFTEESFTMMRCFRFWDFLRIINRWINKWKDKYEDDSLIILLDVLDGMISKRVSIFNLYDLNKKFLHIFMWLCRINFFIYVSQHIFQTTSEKFLTVKKYKITQKVFSRPQKLLNLY